MLASLRSPGPWPRWTALVFALLGALPAAAARQADPAPEPSETPEPVPEGPRGLAGTGGLGLRPPASWLVLDRIDGPGRRPFRPDHVFAEHLLSADAAPPELGSELRGEIGAATWRLAEPDPSGFVEAGGYAFARIEAERDVIAALALEGAATVYVDGVPFAGNVYRYGDFGGVPVSFSAGPHELFVTGIRESFRLSLSGPLEGLVLADFDLTRPDAVAGEGGAHEFAVLVMNATPAFVERVAYRTAAAGGGPVLTGEVAVDLPPLGVTKLPLRCAHPAPGEADGSVLRVQIELDSSAGRVSREIALAVKTRERALRRTFRSRVDGSVQEYALLAPEPSSPARRPGLALSLHGAGVDALQHAHAYAPKPGYWLAAPTNRRPYGFDWQDWGRLDAYEALDDALSVTGADPARIVLTGHSMGGHGTWHLAANDPDRFLAIGPSAGWRDFDSYGGGRPPGALAELWRAADLGGRPEQLLSNLAQIPAYILHGERDATVPVSEALAMRDALAARGAQVEYYGRADADHWWDAEGAGVACVDWPPMAQLFERVQAAAAPLAIEFETVDPGVDADHHWLRVEQLERYGEPARAAAAFDPDARLVRIATENVRCLGVRALPGREVHGAVVDGQELAFEPGLEPGGLTRFVRGRGAAGAPRWERGAPGAGEKSPERTGPFKRAFDRRFVIVVASAGDDAAAWLARARCDAAVWWYRANGCAPVVLDRDFLARADEFAERNVIIYGNAEDCLAWSSLVPSDCPIRPRRGALEFGERTFEGGDLGCAFVWPRAGSAQALVGVLGATGSAGVQLAAALAPFVSGAGYPDYAVFDARVLTGGDAGVLAAGWFDATWRELR